MEYEVPRVSVWMGEIPFSACWDELGNYDTDGPMEIAFNIIPRNVPLPAVINYLKNNGGLNGYASCTANRIGTVSNEAKCVVALNISDRDMANLISSLQSNPDGFIIYDLKRTEAFSNHHMWNDVTENAPGQEDKHLSLGLCQNFGHASEILDEYLRDWYAYLRVHAVHTGNELVYL